MDEFCFKRFGVEKIVSFWYIVHTSKPAFIFLCVTTYNMYKLFLAKFLLIMCQCLILADYAMPKETIIVGDEKGRFLYKSENESRNIYGSAKFISVAVALVFARDKENSCGNYSMFV